jgi:molecular chaperone IbpA
MTSWNRDPFWRTSIGFDRLFDLLDESLGFEPRDNFPPCNIVRTGEDKYRISLAVAGYKPEQIDVTVHQNQLIVAGRPAGEQPERDIVYRGIGAQAFERRFSLADYVEVTAASLEDGLLQIELERRIPEALKPRRIELNAAAPRVQSIAAADRQAA